MVDVTTGDTFERGGTPRLVFPDTYVNGAGTDWDISADGERFLMIRRGEGTDQDGETSQIIVVQNWFEELTHLFPDP